MGTPPDEPSGVNEEFLLFVDDPSPESWYVMRPAFTEILSLADIPSDHCGLMDDAEEIRIAPLSPSVLDEKKRTGTADSIFIDLNSTLTVASGYAHRILNRLSPNDPLYEDAEAMWNATERIALFTRQLSQILRPRMRAAPAGQHMQMRLVPSTETLLVVDDDLALLRLLISVLTKVGYTLLTASTFDEAVRLCRQQEGTIHLLLMDMELNGKVVGPTWAAELKSLRPAMHVLFMTGLLEPERVLKDQVFIRKPFKPIELAGKLRALLDGIREYD
jgi:CheY-like chemotaxis protein